MKRAGLESRSDSDLLDEWLGTQHKDQLQACNGTGAASATDTDTETDMPPEASSINKQSSTLKRKILYGSLWRGLGIHHRPSSSSSFNSCSKAACTVDDVS